MAKNEDIRELRGELQRQDAELAALFATLTEADPNTRLCVSALVDQVDELSYRTASASVVTAQPFAQRV